MEWWIALAVYALAKTFGDSCRDNKLESWLGRIFHQLGAEEWFLGGDNVRWNPSLPWTSDFWHLMEHIKAYSIIYLALGWIDLFWAWKVALALVLLWVIGQIFELLYGYILPLKKKGTLWQWFTRAICFWKRETA